MNQPSGQTGGAVGVLIPQFPTQTHVAMWRVADAMRRLGVRTHMLSTRQPDAGKPCHADLVAEAKQTFYAWPPRWGAVLGWLLTHPLGLLSALGYLLTLKEEPWKRRLKLAVLIASGAGLASYCRREQIGHVLVHSCADAAHLIAITKLLGGPAYSLRLGGDMDVYGVDHAAKMRRATLIAAAAENNRQEVIDRIGRSPDSVVTLPLGVDTRRFRPDDAAASEEGKAGALRLVSVSRLHPRKGLDDVLHAIAIAKERGVRIDYEMVGDGPSRAQLEAMVGELGLADRVTMPGAKGQDGVLSALRRAQAFVLSSHGAGEGSPVAMIEAMACGLAVVSTRVGGTAQMMADGVEGVLVDQRAREQMAEALIRLANEPKTRRAMGEASRRAAQSRYDVLSVGRLLLTRWCVLPGGDEDETGVAQPDRPIAQGKASELA